MAHGGRGRGGDGGGGQQRAVWLLTSLQNPTTGLIWLVTKGGDGGRRREVAHGGRARGEMGGGTKEQCGKLHWFNLVKSLKKPAHGGQARGEMGGGTREQCGSNKRSLFFFLASLKT